MSFLGVWLVSEYVYNPDGSFAGIVRQRRSLAAMPSDRLLVHQICQPEASLAGHPMTAFAGEWVFELSTEGRVRRYHGPDVIGAGLGWGADAMIGQGLWPQFGHNFSSFAILPQPGHQLTGGKFFHASEMVANIVGVALPKAETNGWPDFSGPDWPGDATWRWQGERRSFGPDGSFISEQQVVRIYVGRLWLENGAIIAFEADGRHWQMEAQIGDSQLFGLATQAGPMLEMTAYDDAGHCLKALEVHDAARGHLVGIHRHLRDNQLERVDVLHLRPDN